VQNKLHKNDVANLKTNHVNVISGFRREADENCALLLITQRVTVISYRSSGQSIGPIFKGQKSNCPETSIRNYHHSLRNNPEERSAQIMKTAKWGAAPARL